MVYNQNTNGDIGVNNYLLPNDMENYMQYHIMGSVSKIIIKPGCLPSKFYCQADRKRSLLSTSISRTAALKRQRLALKQEALEESKLKINIKKEYTPPLLTAITRELDAMEEFRMNGVDSPYDPEQETAFLPKADMLGGLGSSSAYLRQKSWPAPERTPIQKLPPDQWKPAPNVNNFPKNKDNYFEGNINNYYMRPYGFLTEEQCRVLSTLPDFILYTLLGCLEKARIDNMTKERVKDNARWENRGTAAVMCRFCRNNGERESFVRSHTLKDCFGRVLCPVLRSFVCTLCGAQGDFAHTIKYCPLSSSEERNKSTAIMKSVRMASGRRRSQATERAKDYVIFGEPTPSVVQDSIVYSTMPLDPMWAALEQKLSM